MEASQPEIVNEIAEKKALSDEMKAKMSESIQAFNTSWS
jgi:F0F1-type ATP synthase alpha subunit